MSEQSRPLARRERFIPATDTRNEQAPGSHPASTPAPTGPSREQLTLTILGVVLFAITVIVLVARTLYSTGP